MKDQVRAECEKITAKEPKTREVASAHMTVPQTASLEAGRSGRTNLTDRLLVFVIMASGGAASVPSPNRVEIE